MILLFANKDSALFSLVLMSFISFNWEENKHKTSQMQKSRDMYFLNKFRFSLDFGSEIELEFLL